MSDFADTRALIFYKHINELENPSALRPKSDIYEHCHKCKVAVSFENFTIDDTFP